MTCLNKKNYNFSLVIVIVGALFSSCGAAIAYAGTCIDSYTSNEFEDAFNICFFEAEGGDASASYYLARIHEKSLSIKSVPKKSLALYKVAAANNHPKANRRLGVLYQYGLLVNRDLRIARDYYRSAASLGDVESLVNLGYFFESGIVGNKDYKKAVQLYLEAMEGGNTDALVSLARCYRMGYGVDRDYRKEESLLLTAAKKGSVSAQFTLGTIYKDKHIKLDKAARWFREAANRGDSMSMYYLATVLEMQGDPKSKLTEAADWYVKAAKTGYFTARVLIAQRHVTREMFETSYLKSYAWLLLAFENEPDLALNDHEVYEIGVDLLAKLEGSLTTEHKKISKEYMESLR